MPGGDIDRSSRLRILSYPHNSCHARTRERMELNACESSWPIANTALEDAHAINDPMTGEAPYVNGYNCLVCLHREKLSTRFSRCVSSETAKPSCARRSPTACTFSPLCRS